MTGKSAMSKLERVLKDENVTKKTKIKIAVTLVFPLATYGSKSWTKKDRKKLDAFKLWVWQKILRVS